MYLLLCYYRDVLIAPNVCQVELLNKLILLKQIWNTQKINGTNWVLIKNNDIASQEGHTNIVALPMLILMLK